MSALLGLYCFFWTDEGEVSAFQPEGVNGLTVILDAGHGGEDGGAVSLTGVPESYINLDITLRLEDIFAFYGVAPTVLRREDLSLHDSEADTLRKKKVSDIHNRVDTIESVPNAMLISIHQNTYQQAKYRGAHVFYAPTDGSRDFAVYLQNYIQTTLQSENTREAKQIPDSIYLMNHISCPAVLVECGFLTNPEEEALLRTSEYQTKVAAVLASAWLTAPAMGEVIQG